MNGWIVDCGMHFFGEGGGGARLFWKWKTDISLPMESEDNMKTLLGVIRLNRPFFD